MAVELEMHDGIALITINRPEARNAIDGLAALEFERIIKVVEEDDTVRAAIIVGAAGHFCAGMDLKAYARGEVVRFPDTGFAGFTQAKLKKPFIAAVDGYALGGGCELVLACDIVIASDNAKFGLTEVKRGLVANGGGLLRLPRQIPLKIAAELILTGDIFPASRLASCGLVNHVVPEAQVLSKAFEVARTIAENGPMAVSVSRQVIYDSLEWPAETMFERQFEFTAPVFTSRDATEGALAFAQKRAPVWQGR